MPHLPKNRFSKLLIAGSVLGLIVAGALLYLVGNAWFGLPVGARGPEQPVAFQHPVHAGPVEKGGLGLDCTFCHRNVDKGAAATIPSVEQCMFCHSQIKGGSEEAQREIAKFMGQDETGLAFAKGPIEWVRVHRLPDHVHFLHDIHVQYLMHNPDVIENATGLTILPDGTVNAAQTCSTCHGAVAQMKQVKQVRDLKMGDCVDCHRQNNAPTDCAICHY